jgi:hypothetical protein
MTRHIEILIAAVLAGSLAFAADSPTTEPTRAPSESGRVIIIHMLNGREVKGLLLGCKDGKIEFTQNGQPAAIPLTQVRRIGFGKAIGPKAGQPRPPASPSPGTGPSNPPAITPERYAQTVREFALDKNRLGVVFAVAIRSLGYMNVDALRGIAVKLKEALDYPKAELGVRINAHIGLALVHTALNDPKSVEASLKELRSVAPDQAKALTVRQFRPLALSTCSHANQSVQLIGRWTTRYSDAEVLRELSKDLVSELRGPRANRRGRRNLMLAAAVVHVAVDDKAGAERILNAIPKRFGLREPTTDVLARLIDNVRRGGSLPERMKGRRGPDDERRRPMDRLRPGFRDRRPDDGADTDGLGEFERP